MSLTIDQNANVPKNIEAPEGDLSLYDFMDYLNDKRTLFPVTEQIRQAMRQGFLYDIEGQPVRDEETLVELQNAQSRGNLPMLFRDPADKTGTIHCLQGTRLFQHLPANKFIAGLFDIRFGQPTTPVEVPEMTFREKLGNFFSFGLWKPARVRRAERQNEVSRMERLKIVENMGVPVSRKESRKYKKLRGLTLQQLNEYIDSKKMPKASKQTEPPRKKTPEERREELAERNRQRLQHEAGEAVDTLKGCSFYGDPNYAHGIELIEDYLRKCQDDPKSEQCPIVNSLRTLIDDDYDFPEFVKSMSQKQTTPAQFEALMKTAVNLKMHFGQLRSLHDSAAFRENTIKTNGDKFGLAAAYGMATQKGQNVPANENPQLGGSQVLGGNLHN